MIIRSNVSNYTIKIKIGWSKSKLNVSNYTIKIKISILQDPSDQNQTIIDCLIVRLQQFTDCNESNFDNQSTMVAGLREKGGKTSIMTWLIWLWLVSDLDGGNMTIDTTVGNVCTSLGGGCDPNTNEDYGA